jgi:hypothetical protein
MFLNQKKITKIKELLPVNPRKPTDVQLKSTRRFLTELSLQKYAENFERCGLGNLSNLFQLDARDLHISLGISLKTDQDKIISQLLAIKNFYLNQSPALIV